MGGTWGCRMMWEGMICQLRKMRNFIVYFIENKIKA